jgi:hypothetical protein
MTWVVEVMSSVWPSGGGCRDDACSDRAAGAGPIVDDGLMAGQLGKLGHDDASGCVRRAAWGVGDDDAYRFGRIVLRMHSHCRQERRGGGEQSDRRMNADQRCLPWTCIWLVS